MATEFQILKWITALTMFYRDLTSSDPRKDKHLLVLSNAYFDCVASNPAPHQVDQYRRCFDEVIRIWRANRRTPGYSPLSSLIKVADTAYQRPTVPLHPGKPNGYYFTGEQVTTSQEYCSRVMTSASLDALFRRDTTGGLSGFKRDTPLTEDQLEAYFLPSADDEPPIDYPSSDIVATRPGVWVTPADRVESARTHCVVTKKELPEEMRDALGLSFMTGKAFLVALGVRTANLASSASSLRRPTFVDGGDRDPGYSFRSTAAGENGWGMTARTSDFRDGLEECVHGPIEANRSDGHVGSTAPKVFCPQLIGLVAEREIKVDYAACAEKAPVPWERWMAPILAQAVAM